MTWYALLLPTALALGIISNSVIAQTRSPTRGKAQTIDNTNSTLLSFEK